MQPLLHDPILTLAVVLAAGLGLGRVPVAGLRLGSSGVLVAGLLAGHAGARLPEGLGSLGLVLFVYCVGLASGPSFFRAFARHGSQLALLSVGVTLLAAGLSIVLTRVLALPGDLAIGLFAGAMTSTPALAAATQCLPGAPGIAVGYGIAYPFGILGVVAVVQALPRLLGLDLAQGAKGTEGGEDEERIERQLVEVQNPAMDGSRIEDLDLGAENVAATRVLKDHAMVPIPRDFVLAPGQVLMLVGRSRRLKRVIPMLGRLHLKSGYTIDIEASRRPIVCTSSEVVGRTLRELAVLHRFGVTIARIRRHEVEFVPDADQPIQYGDALVAVGEAGDLDAFARFAGHREKVFDSTDLAGLSLGLALGLLLGATRITLGSASLQLGAAGGPFLLGLVLGHFGRIGPLAGSLPRAARLLLTELGLALFLSEAGCKAGSSLGPVLAQQGLVLAAASTVLAGVPCLLGFFLARRVLGLDPLPALGGLCGAMTSTPGLGALAALSDSGAPAIAYAAAYPVALVLMTLLVPLVLAAYP